MTLAGLFSDAAARYPDRVCIMTSDREWTYREINGAINALAHGLQGLGIKPGDKVALLAPNSPEFIVSFFAVLAINAVLVPVNVKYKEQEIRYVLEHSDAAALIVDGDYGRAVAAVRADLPGLERIVRIDRAGSSDSDREGAHDYQALIRESSSEACPSRVHPEDEALFFYTSGTTGRPKAAVCTHGNCLAAMDGWIAALGITEQSRSLMVTPFFHNAFNAFVATLFRAGGSTVIIESFQMKTLLGEISRTQPTLLFATPSIYISMLSAPQIAGARLGSLSTIVYGAAPMPVEVIKSLRPVFPNALLFNAYAQSETCPAISYLRPEYALTKAGSVGQEVPGVEIAIFDDANQPLPAKGLGEICVRGPHVMKGYYRQPDATRAKLIDGWLHTGDLGYLDEDGFLYLVDRKDDLIITGGENVYPKEIEEVLYTHPDILEAAVVGVPDRVKGSVTAAFVVPRPQRTIHIGDVRRFCVDRLADFKVPRSFRVVDALPRNASGKIVKPELRRRWDSERADQSRHGEKEQVML